MGVINVLSLSYGKDSLATIAACEKLGIPIHRIIHAEVWATDEISADLPPMVEFKKKADAIIKERWGIEVEHICAMTTPEKKYGFFHNAPLMGGGESNPTNTPCISKSAETTDKTSGGSPPSRVDGADTSNRKVKLTYEDIFYRPIKKPRRERERERTTASLKSKGNGAMLPSRGEYYGFPMGGTWRGNWRQSLKRRALRIPIRSSCTGNGMVSGTQSTTPRQETLFQYAPTTGGRNKYCCKPVRHRRRRK